MFEYISYVVAYVRAMTVSTGCCAYKFETEFSSFSRLLSRDVRAQINNGDVNNNNNPTRNDEGYNIYIYICRDEGYGGERVVVSRTILYRRGDVRRAEFVCERRSRSSAERARSLRPVYVTSDASDLSNVRLTENNSPQSSLLLPVQCLRFLSTVYLTARVYHPPCATIVHDLFAVFVARIQRRIRPRPDVQTIDYEPIGGRILPYAFADVCANDSLIYIYTVMYLERNFFFLGGV